MNQWNQNRLTAKLGIEYPIVQGPLGGLSSQRLTAAVSNFGGLGSYGAHSRTPDEIKAVGSLNDDGVDLNVAMAWRYVSARARRPARRGTRPILSDGSIA